jgi:ParB family chromosome partitioning protein
VQRILIWGERRWRASRLAGLTAIRCKVLPRGDDSAVEQLQTKERQWAENMEREGHSPIEEAIAIQDAVDLERKLDPEATVGDVVEKVGAERGLNGIVARNLVGLLKAPRSLQSAMMGGAIGRELGFELMRFWNKLLADNALRGEAKREIQYRNLVEAWARARGAEIDAATMRRYATETFQDPQVVKATCRKAEDSQRALVERFDALVAKVQREGWTVARAKAELPACRRNGGKLPDVTRLPCFERGGKGNARLIVYLDRVREPTLGNPAARAELLGVLRSLVAELETGRASSQPTGSQAAHPAWMRPRL